MGVPFKLKNGSVAVSVEAPGGLYNSAHLKKLAALAEQQSLIMKATEDQRIVLFVTPDQEEALTKELASSGMAVRAFQDGVHQPVACLGALCPDSQQDALKASLDISEAIAEIEASSCLKIGLNGCGKCCVPCHTMDISVIGAEDGYRISIGGKQSLVPELGSFVAEGVPAEAIVEKVKAVVDAWVTIAEPGEPLHATIERVGMTQFIDVLAPYSGDAAGAFDESDGGSLSTETEDVMADETNQQIEGSDEGGESNGTLSEEAGATEVSISQEPEIAVSEGVTESATEDVPEGATDDQPSPETEGSSDGGSADAGSVEAGSVEAGSVEAGSVEAGSVEAGSADAPINGTPEEEVEAAVTASIDDEAAVPEVADENAHEREEVLDSLPEVISEVAPDVAPEAANMGDAGALTDISAPTDVAASDMAVEPPVDQPAEEVVAIDSTAGSESDMNVLPINSSEPSGTFEEVGVEQSAEASVGESVSLGGTPAIQSLTGMEVDAKGRFVLAFEGSASITVDPSIIPFGGARCIKFAGKELRISADATGFNVEVDGLTFHMPLDVAA